MSFPSPTSGLGTAAVVTVTGTGLVKLASQLVNQATAQNTAPSGTQFNAWFGGSFPGGADFDSPSGVGATGAAPTSGGKQYGLTLSVSAAGGFNSTCQLTVQATDVAGKAVADTGVEYVSYADPAFTGFAPSVASATGGFPVPTRSNGVVASVSGSGLITALGVGQAIIEVQVPFALNTIASQTVMNNAIQGVANSVFAQIVVQVIP